MECFPAKFQVSLPLINRIFIFGLSVHLESKSHFQIIKSLFNVTASITEHRGTSSVARNKTLELQRECDYSYCSTGRQLRGAQRY
jgi:hypothetical protein